MPAIRWLLALAVVATLGAAACAPAGSAYPERPVTMVVMDPPGGATDQAARPLVEAVKPFFSQPINIVSRPGGAGTVAAVEVLQAPPDGYTIGLQAVGAMALQPQRTNLPYKSTDDYRPVINLVIQPLVLGVRADAPWQTMQELLDYARANPGRVRVGLPGAGTIAHINLELLKEQAGVSFTHVPFTGAAESIPALLGGHVDAVIAGPPGLVGHVQAGKAGVLGAFEAQRDPVLPDVPTFRELGYDITLGGYFFLVVPKGTPDHVVQTLHDAFKQALESDDYRQFAQSHGFVVDYKGPEELKQQLDRDGALFAEMVKKLELK